MSSNTTILRTVNNSSGEHQHDAFDKYTDHDSTVNYVVGLDDSVGNYVIGVGSNLGDNPKLTLASNGDIDVSDNLNIGDGLNLTKDGGVFSLGAGQDIKLTHGTGGTSGDEAPTSSLVSAGSFTLDSSGGSLILDGHTGVQIDATNSGNIELNTAAGGDILIANDEVAMDVKIGNFDNATTEIELNSVLLDINTGTGGVDLDSSGGVNIASAANGASAVVLTASAGGVDITATGAAAGEDINITATGSSVNITSTENDAAAVKINASAGSIDIDSADNITVDAADEITITTTSADGHISLVSAHTAGVAFHLDANADAGSIVDIDAGILDIDATGAVQINADGASNLTTSSGALTLDGASGVSIAGNASEVDITTTGELDINSGTIDIDASSTLKIDSAGAASNISHTATTDGDFTIEMDGSVDASLILKSTGTAADALQITTTVGGMDITVGGNAAGEDLDIVSTQSINLTANESGVADAIKINASAGSIDIDSADNITVDAADEITITTTSADGHISLVSAHTAGVAFHLDANADAGSIVDIDAGILDIDATGAVQINADGASNLTTSSGALTLDGASGVSIAGNASEVDITTTGELDINSGTIDIDASSTLKIDSAGAASNISHTATTDGDFTIEMDGSVDASLILKSTGTAADALQITTTAGGIDITNGGAAGGEDIDITSSNASINITANEAVADAITINSTGGGIKLDAETDISLDAKGDDIKFLDNGTEFGSIQSNSGELRITSGSSTTTAITFDASNATFANNVAISGNLTVTGTTELIHTTNTDISDNLIVLNNGRGTGSDTPSVADTGILIDRGTAANAFMGWDEANDKFTVGTHSSATGTSNSNFLSSNFTVSPFACGNITSEDITAEAIDCSNLIIKHSGSKTITNNTAIGEALTISAATYNDDATTSSGTQSKHLAGSILNRPTFTASNSSVTVTKASTLLIPNAPDRGTNIHATAGNFYALYVEAGSTRFADVTMTSQTITSDQKLKENVVEIDNAMDKVNNLRGVYFDWKDKENYSDRRQLGFIAQEVEAVIPELVEEKEEGIKSVNYAQTVSLLLQGMKEQNLMIKQLQQEVEDLKSKIN